MSTDPGVTPPRALASKTRWEFIETVGSLCRRLGFPRTVGQSYGLLFLSPKPQSLEAIASALDISKASASTGTRLLSSWGAIREVWVPGSRKDHFQAVAELDGLLRNAYREFVRPRLDASQRRLDRMLETLEADHEAGSLSKEDLDFCRERLQSLARFQKALQSLAPWFERLL